MGLNNTNVNGVESLSNTASKHGTVNFLLGIMGFVLLTLLAGLGFIIKQNSDAISSIPRDLALLTQKLDQMDRKLDMIFMEKFDITLRQK
ncbi:MAG: hypothetical protein ACRCZ2_07250 [Fusobacteriaceae bacterium]